MKIALSSDEWLPVHTHVLSILDAHNIAYELFGSFKTKADYDWVDATVQAATAIQNNLCHEGIFFCWSGTGTTIVANKINGIRAALCPDPDTAQLARTWNHANVLGLANKSITKDTFKDILNAWLLPFNTATAQKYIDKINAL